MNDIYRITIERRNTGDKYTIDLDRDKYGEEFINGLKANFLNCLDFLEMCERHRAELLKNHSNDVPWGSS